ncbi:MAG: hypothetical protein IJP66_05320, partial [Kiritimatiellae bacterium]|nr:hypothetical protein [Kiritimatiellia bacterium]
MNAFAICALAVPAASRATVAKVLFGSGLSFDGITFAPSAFSASWAGYSAMGAGENPAVNGGAQDAAVITRAFNLPPAPAGTAVFSGT